MEASNVRFDYKTISEVLRGLFRNKREDAAIAFFVDIFHGSSDLSLIPGKDAETDSFYMMIEGLSDCDRIEDAQKRE